MFHLPSVSIRRAESVGDLDLLRVLLSEYAAYLTGTLGSENMCMQRYEEELSTLPYPYQILLLAFADADTAGCVLLKAISLSDDRGAPERACELKRLWVRPQFRGLRIGRELTEHVMREAKQEGYTTIYLDTVPAAMQAAHGMYLAMGFESIGRYNDNPVSNVEFFRRRL